ncbi:thiol:disulfide interchange protein DsbG [Alcanivorax hongdengensis A-11-3]|uniref:Thiol:disulfide interchange protein DsbG n=1 Tax=Alcanivorax hongdengensis A-11-3 TaxID=1177179 RepID=L0WBF8_9GAMM|nr:thiol:disulfide interchange protein DsbG [Alcanivorax hongdengensis]EKF73402.1 thiol:disulfide interchange protein DsbG [Alcanivorax hongdengensis A-11-3]
MKHLAMALFGLLLPLAGLTAERPAVLDKLAASTWVAEGPAQPERVAYMFTDMACPYCAKMWAEMQPMLNNPANTVQVRHIIVGLINPDTSFSQGAAVLAADDPAAALARHESRFREGGIQPLNPVPDAQRQAIQANTRLMMAMGLGGTPTMVFQDSQQRWRFAPGLMDKRDLRNEVFQLPGDAMSSE